MNLPDASPLQQLQTENLKINIFATPEAASTAAAHAAAEEMRSLAREHSSFGVIFATGNSQLELLRVLTSMNNLPWQQVEGFHLDEYRNLDVSHRASFRNYLRRHLTQRVSMRSFAEIDGSAPDAAQVCQDYSERLRDAAPRLCLLGVGENGHLAFNDPEEANFNDPRDVKLVQLDDVCRQQQVAEGWFPALADVPAAAITVTIPAILRVPRLIVTVLGSRKQAVMRRVLEEAISPRCPATILRTHPAATLYVDREAWPPH